MLGRSVIVWKLSAVFGTIILLVFVVSRYIDKIVDEHYALASACDLCRVNAATVRQSIEKALMARDNEGVGELFSALARNSADYREIRLVAHDGEVVASWDGAVGEVLAEESRACQICHQLENPRAGAAAPHHDEIVELPDGSRVVSVITPILNEPGCAAAGCHAEADEGAVMGLLQTDYSLSRVDAIAAAHNAQTGLATIIAIVLGGAATWFMAGRLLERPMRNLVEGMQRIARGDLDFRMNVPRSGEFVIVADSFNDMTAKLELLLYRLRETKEYLEGIVESSADIIVTVNRSGFIQTFNTGAEIALGYSREEVVDQRVEMLFADPQERDVAIARLKHSDSVVNHEARFLTKGGEIREVIFSIARLRGPYGFPIGTFAIGKDVTHEKELQRLVIQSERFAAIGQSFTAIQHTMKNMLNALPGGAYMVKKGIEKKDVEVIAQGWEIVARGIDGVRDLSKSLLRYVRDWEPELEWVAVEKIVGMIEAVYAQTAADSGVTLNTDIPPDLPEVHCDPSLIHSAIMDIVSNALEACESKAYEEGESARIELSMKHLPESDRLAVEIRDNGPGMTEQVRANIFTPFFSTKKKKGTGLGLALTSRIVSLHGASIDVTSEPGKWAAFRILLPVAGPEENKEHCNGEEGSDRR